MNEVDNIKSPYCEGVDIPKTEAEGVWKYLVSEGHKWLDGTGFTTTGIVDDQDLVSLKNFYQAVLNDQESRFDKQGAVFNRSLREHLGLAERLAEIAATYLKIETNQLKALMLTHDFGRMMSHRRGRNNAIEAALTRKLGFSEEFTKLLPPDTLRTEVDKEALAKRLESMTTENNGVVGIVELLDVLAKWQNKERGKLRRFADIIPKSRSAQHEPDPDTMWPSELHRQRKITSHGGHNAISEKYTYLGAWFEKKTGIHIDQVMQEVEESLRSNPISYDWI